MKEFDMIVHYDPIGEGCMYNCHEVGELVRCRDCIYWEQDEEELATGWCNYFYTDFTPKKQNDDYCSLAERRGEK